MSEDTEEKKEPAAKPKKSKKMLFIIVGVVVVLLLGVGAFLMLGSKPPAEVADAEHGEENHEEAQLETIKLEPFIVNLSENGSFLKITLLLEYNAKLIHQTDVAEGAHGAGGGESKGASMPPVFSLREPMIRDAVIKVLSSKKSDEVLSPDGKIKLKEDLLEAINEALALDEPAVINVYFTEFIIQ